MLSVMLCGAADVRAYYTAFKKTVEAIGGEPAAFLDGSTPHVNLRGRGWEENSREAINSAQLCVVVVNEEYGQITWQEVEALLAAQRPFILMALAETWTFYQGLVRRGANLDQLPGTSRELFLSIGEADRKEQLTFRTFDDASDFPQKLQKAFTELLRRGLGAISLLEANRRQLLQAQGERDELVNHVNDLQGTLQLTQRDAHQLRDEVAAATAAVSNRRGPLAALLAVRAPAVVGTLVVVLGLGMLGGVLLAKALGGGSYQFAASAQATSARASSTANIPSPSVGDERPTGGSDNGLTLPFPAQEDYSTLDCGGGGYVSFLGAYQDTKSPLAAMKVKSHLGRAGYLRKRTHVEVPKAHMSRGPQTCGIAVWNMYETTPDGKVFVWMGPFSTQAKANRACHRAQYAEVDCLGVPMSRRW